MGQSGRTHIYAGRKTLILTMQEIKALLPMEECIKLQEAVFAAHAAGDATNAPAMVLMLAGESKWIRVIAGYVGDGIESMGVKILARFTQNPPGMNLGSLIALFDTGDGFPYALMDGVYLTALRTAAGGALSVRYCARSTSKKLGIIGSGVQARFNCLGIKQITPQIDRVTVFSRSSLRESFAREMQEQTGTAVIPVESVEEAVHDVDVIVTATNSPRPVLNASMIGPGVHIVAVGSNTEMDLSILRGNRVIADGTQTAKEHGRLSLALKAGVASESDLKGELGDVILGRISGRSRDDEITVFDSSGLAIQDIACAHYVHRKARELGKGTWIDLGLGERP